jgi:hypothetical protein
MIANAPNIAEECLLRIGKTPKSPGAILDLREIGEAFIESSGAKVSDLSE